MQSHEACCSYNVEWPCHVWDLELAEDIVESTAYKLAINQTMTIGIFQKQYKTNFMHILFDDIAN